MAKDRTISTEELQKFGQVDTINEKLFALSKQQNAHWEILHKNHKALQSTQSRKYTFGSFKIETQYNPERIRSSAAKTDKKSIENRRCFLCLNNLPEQQKGILLHSEYLILCNPFPIFENHYTISKLDHSPQLIKNSFIDLLAISKSLSEFTVFYNGPASGASAPDHLHFQACNKNILPVEKEYENLKNNFSNHLITNKNIKIFSVKNYLRKMIVMESDSINSMKEYFDYIYRLIQIVPGEEEPRMNIICNFSDKQWRVIIIPRGKQRPAQFFKEGKEQIIIGPASVEMGGILILPRKEDFDKVTKADIEDIFNQVSIPDTEFENLELYI